MALKQSVIRTACICFIVSSCLLTPLQVKAEETINIIDQSVAVYPIDVEEKTENGYGIIVRTYALKPHEKTSDIPLNSFSKYGIRYELSEVIKKENRTNEFLEHIETVTINSASNDMNEILKQISQEIIYEKDGYSGVLSLDLASVNCEPAGYITQGYTKSVKREFPNLASQDTSSIPKSVTDGGATYDFDTVEFKPQNTNSIDYEEIATSYTAVATYTRSGSTKNVTGYITTANYTGTIEKVMIDETIYKVYFISKEPIEEIEAEPQPTELLEDPQNIKIEGNSAQLHLLPVVLSLISVLVTGGIGSYFIIYNTRNTVIFSKSGIDYHKIGQLKVDYKADLPIIDLNKLKNKPDNKAFVIEISKSAMKKIIARSDKKRVLAVHYIKDTLMHTISDSVQANRYQFEVDFSEDKGDVYYEEE